MPAYTQPHRKQLIGEYVHAFTDLQPFHTPSCSRNNHFILYNEKVKWKEFLYILTYSISFELLSKYWDQAGTPYLQAPSESTWALPLNIALPCSVGRSDTVKEESVREEDSLQFSALHRTAGSKISRLPGGAGNLTWCKMQPTQHILCSKNLKKMLPLALFQVFSRQIGFSRRDPPIVSMDSTTPVGAAEIHLK